MAAGARRGALGRRRSDAVRANRGGGAVPHCLAVRRAGAARDGRAVGAGRGCRRERQRVERPGACRRRIPRRRRMGCGVDRPPRAAGSCPAGPVAVRVRPPGLRRCARGGARIALRERRGRISGRRQRARRRRSRARAGVDALLVAHGARHRRGHLARPCRAQLPESARGRVVGDRALRLPSERPPPLRRPAAGRRAVASRVRRWISSVGAHGCVVDGIHRRPPCQRALCRRDLRRPRAARRRGRQGMGRTGVR